MYINYRSISDLNETLIKNLHKFPHDVSLIVGIPRSGMLPANLLALYLNKPFTDIDSFIEGRVYHCGERGTFIHKNETEKVLIVDDSIASGNALNKAKEKLRPFLIAHPNITILYAAVFSTKNTDNMVDIFCENIEGNRIFQWNLFHHAGYIPLSIFDIDGVLCPNPPIDDDGPLYRDYIANAPVLYKPSLRIDKLVSCRLEKYRTLTEDWLARNGIEYNELHMLQFNTKDERIQWGKHGEYKGIIYKKSNDILFIESSLQEALDIFKVSKKPVFCIENFKMINDESYMNQVKSTLYHSFPFHKLKCLIKKLIGEKAFLNLKTNTKN